MKLWNYLKKNAPLWQVFIFGTVIVGILNFIIWVLFSFIENENIDIKKIFKISLMMGLMLGGGILRNYVYTIRKK